MSNSYWNMPGPGDLANANELANELANGANCERCELTMHPDELMDGLCQPCREKLEHQLEVVEVDLAGLTANRAELMERLGLTANRRKG